MNDASRKNSTKTSRATVIDLPAPRSRNGKLRYAESPADNILALIHVFSNLIGQAFYSRLEGDHGLTVPQWRIHPGSTAVDIVARWASQPMSISRAVRELQQRGLIIRRVQSSDRRSHALHLTAKGWRLYKAVLPDANARYRDIVGCVAPGERAQLARTLVKLAENTKRLL